MNIQEQIDWLKDHSFTQIEVVHDSDGNNYISSQDPLTDSNICFEIGCDEMTMADKVMEAQGKFNNFEPQAARDRTYERLAEIEAARAQL